MSINDCDFLLEVKECHLLSNSLCLSNVKILLSLRFIIHQNTYKENVCLIIMNDAINIFCMRT